MQSQVGLRKYHMNKVSGGDGIPAELFQILKYDAVKVLHSICQQLWKTQQWPQDWKRSIFILIPKRGNAKGCSNYHKTALISHASKVMFKILQARLQSMWTKNFQMYKLDLEKAEESEFKLPTEFQKNIYVCFTDYEAKALDCVDHNKLWRIWKRWEYQTTWPASWEIGMQVKKQQLELHMEQWTGSRLGKKSRIYIITLLI